ncbi:MAG: hypothetical protein M3Y84_00440 [Acidobacteriota bacterium]|nr:hypothetical protein [Acidobacteriota bacterium]
MRQTSSLIRVVVAAVAVSFSLGCNSTALAQSGRHVRKPMPAPVATAAPEPAPTPNKAAEKVKALLTFIVGIDRYNGFSNIPLYYYDSVSRGCAERLKDATGVKADIAHGEMSRSDAINRARAEKEAYVVWLQLSSQNINNTPGTVNNVNDIYLEYSVYAPTTAKRVAWGHTYQGARKRGVVVGPSPSGRGNRVYSEYLLKQAARDAAERILDVMKIGSTPGIP